MVLVYNQRQGVVQAVQAFESKSTNELKVVQKLLEALALQDVMVTLEVFYWQKNNTVSC